MHEFDWGGGGYPENSFGGTFQLNNSYIVGNTKDDITTYPVGDELYGWIQERNFYPSASIRYKSYTPSGVQSKPSIQVLYPLLSLQDASYWVPSNYGFHASGAATPYSAPNLAFFEPVGNPTYNYPHIQIIEEFTDQPWPTGTRNSSNIQQTGSDANISQSFVAISQSLASGERWFASMYYGTGSGGLNTIYGLSNIADTRDLNQIGYPFEVGSLLYDTAGSPPYNFIIKFKDTIWPTFAAAFNSDEQSLDSIGWTVGSGSASTYNWGFLLTKGISQENSIIIYGDKWQNLSVNQGYITTLYPKPIITQNANYISKTYGNKPA